ncbi:hypothetical protein [Dyella sp. 20L07]|uniref:hypothetical protein n=1 Tax=Dyella sp. 20L07 TaxID=3384240 RepID=UPI003D27638E
MPTNLLWNWLPATVVMVAISVIYYVTDNSPRTITRFVVSAHGAFGAIIFSVAIAVWTAGRSSIDLAWPFTLLFVLPVASMLASLILYRGNKQIHLLLVPNLICMAWAWVVGGMAVTNDWL